MELTYLKFIRYGLHVHLGPGETRRRSKSGLVRLAGKGTNSPELREGL